MQLVPSLLFGIASSLDALLTGAIFGIRGVRILFWQNLLISAITLVGTCLSVGLGMQLVTLLPGILWKSAGSLILILFGFYYLIKFMRTLLKKYMERKQLTATQSLREEKQPSAMSVREACVLGCALSANNIGIGLSASIAGLSLLPAATVTFLFSLAFLYLGNCIGKCRFLQFTEHLSDLISGLLLILLGIVEFGG